MLFKKKVETNKYKVEEFARALGIEELTCELLLTRGIDSIEEAKNFLNPSIKKLPDFKQYTGVIDAIERINQALQNSETVVVYGDYDCDGICASAILSESLKAHGIQTFVFIPKRLEEGYGLCVETLEKIAEEYFPDLIITVDCGITSVEEVEYCRNELGIDVIVTDHHEPPEILPDCITINPHLDKDKGLFNDFCGAGVAYMLVDATFGREYAYNFLDVVAIATMGDIVPLTGINRILVNFGIKKLKKSPIVGLKQLMDSLNIQDNITSYDISFKIVPRINSLGRLGDASRAVSLFTEKDYFVLSCLINEMNEENAERQKLCQQIEEEAKILARDYINEERAIVLCGEWHKGILGITASKLVEKFNRPVILFSIEDNQLTGSCRSIPQINIYETLSRFSSYFTRFGGHSQAAGLSMPIKNFNSFREGLFAYLKSLPEDKFLKTCEYDVDLNEREVSEKFFDELKLFEPFGYSNPKPLFSASLSNVTFNHNKNNPAHISAQTKHGYSISGFYKGDYIDLLNSKSDKQAILSLSKNIFNGREYSQAIIEDVVFKNVTSTNIHKELKNYAISALFKGLNAKVLQNEDFYKVLLKSFRSNIYGNIAICYTFESYKKVCFVLDEANISYEKFYDVKTSENTLNCVIYSPRKDYFDNYDNCFFIDAPLSYPTSKDKTIYSLDNVCALKETLLNRNFDRNKVARIFLKIKNLMNFSIFRSFDALVKAVAPLDEEDEVDIFLVWLILNELNIVYFNKEKNCFTLNNIKTELTNSSLYCIISGNE